MRQSLLESTFLRKLEPVFLRKIVKLILNTIKASIYIEGCRRSPIGTPKAGKGGLPYRTVGQD